MPKVTPTFASSISAPGSNSSKPGPTANTIRTSPASAAAFIAGSSRSRYSSLVT